MNTDATIELINLFSSKNLNKKGFSEEKLLRQIKNLEKEGADINDALHHALHTGQSSAFNLLYNLGAKLSPNDLLKAIKLEINKCLELKGGYVEPDHIDIYHHGIKTVIHTINKIIL